MWEFQFENLLFFKEQGIFYNRLPLSKAVTKCNVANLYHRHRFLTERNIFVC